MISPKLAYTLSEMCNEIITRYSLYYGHKDMSEDEREQLRENLRKKMIDICKKTFIGEGNNQQTLWERSTQLKDGNKKPAHIFTEADKEFIFTCDEMQDYARKRTKAPEIFTEYEENLKLAKEQNRIILDDAELLQAHGDEFQYNVSLEELRTKELEIMIRALFLQYFTPIDVGALRADMELQLWSSGGKETPDSIAAIKRLKDGTAYYKKL